MTDSEGLTPHEFARLFYPGQPAQGQRSRRDLHQWKKHVGRRNIVESRYTVASDNYHLKRASHRKGRGLARHVLDLGMIASAYNLQMIRDWLLERMERLHENGTLEAPPNWRDRRPRSSSAAARIEWLRRRAVADKRESERGRDRRRKHSLLV